MATDRQKRQIESLSPQSLSSLIYDHHYNIRPNHVTVPKLICSPFLERPIVLLGFKRANSTNQPAYRQMVHYKKGDALCCPINKHSIEQIATNAKKGVSIHY